MKTKELKIYNKIIKYLEELKLEGEDKRIDLVCYLLEQIFLNGKLPNEEVERRFSFLVNSSNEIAGILENISVIIEKCYEKDNPTILGCTMKDILIIENIYNIQEDYVIVLMDYENKSRFKEDNNLVETNTSIAKELEGEVSKDIKRLLRKRKN